LAAFESHKLSDRSDLQVNLANGNLVIHGQDLSIRGYDAGNSLTALAEPGGSISGSACGSNPCSSFQYNNNGQRTKSTFPGGATLNIGYDNAGNETSVVGKSSSSAVLTSFS